MLMRRDQEQFERDSLASYAALSAESRGREYPIGPCNLRTEYQRDRDRIIHCAAFRKLEYKTQVYVIHVGDYYRTRLTHTMEVAQIARSLSRTLRLNSDLAEAIALAHDLGHTPFGHSGEMALNRLMKEHGGFEHNRQGIRVVERLEERNSEYPGLNLTWEVREGIAKHSTCYDAPDIGRFEPDLLPPLEAQLVEVADEIAFHHHDLDDALKMGIVTLRDLKQIPWIDEMAGKDDKEFDDRFPFARLRLVGAMIDMAVYDVLEQTENLIGEAGVRSLDDVRRAGIRVVQFSPEARVRYNLLRTFLYDNVYRHPDVVRHVIKSTRFVEQLFHHYRSTPALLPNKYQNRIAGEGLERVIADYISGMTDRYCIDEYRRLFLP